MITVKLSLSEIYYLALLLNQKTILGFPNLIGILDEDAFQEQMDAAREILLDRKILTRDKDGKFDVNADILNIIICCCNTTQYISFSYEAKGINEINEGTNYQVMYYKANDSETLAYKKPSDDFLYEFYLLQDKESFKNDIKTNIYDMFQQTQTSDILYFTINPQIMRDMLSGDLDVTALDGEDTEKTEFIKDFMLARNIYYIERNKKTDAEWVDDRIVLLGVKNNLWLYDIDLSGEVNIAAVNEELYQRLLSDIVE